MKKWQSISALAISHLLILGLGYMLGWRSVGFLNPSQNLLEYARAIDGENRSCMSMLNTEGQIQMTLMREVEPLLTDKQMDHLLKAKETASQNGYEEASCRKK